MHEDEKKEEEEDDAHSSFSSGSSTSRVVMSLEDMIQEYLTERSNLLSREFSLLPLPTSSSESRSVAAETIDEEEEKEEEDEEEEGCTSESGGPSVFGDIILDAPSMMFIRRRRIVPSFLSDDPFFSRTTTTVMAPPHVLWHSHQTVLDWSTFSETQTLSLQSVPDEFYRWNEELQLEPKYTICYPQTTAEAKSDFCGICRCDYRPDEMIDVLGCGHMFHQECIREAVRFQHSQCPQCRLPMTVSKKNS